MISGSSVLVLFATTAVAVAAFAPATGGGGDAGSEGGGSSSSTRVGSLAGAGLAQAEVGEAGRAGPGLQRGREEATSARMETNGDTGAGQEASLAPPPQAATSRAPKIYTNQFVIQVRGGELEARKLAKKHGFVYLNHILGDYYHLEHRRLSRRSTSASQEAVNISIQEEPQVSCVHCLPFAGHHSMALRARLSSGGPTLALGKRQALALVRGLCVSRALLDT